MSTDNDSEAEEYLQNIKSKENFVIPVLDISSIKLRLETLKTPDSTDDETSYEWEAPGTFLITTKCKIRHNLYISCFHTGESDSNLVTPNFDQDDLIVSSSPNLEQQNNLLQEDETDTDDDDCNDWKNDDDDDESESELTPLKQDYCKVFVSVQLILSQTQAKKESQNLWSSNVKWRKNTSSKAN